MSEDEWLTCYAKYKFLKETEIEIQSIAIKKGILEAAAIIFKDEPDSNTMDS